MATEYKNWGVGSQEQTLKFPCDRYDASFSDTWFRGITIHAESEVIFKWICQMRVAPYSYDWIDNLGRHSPQTITPGLQQLEIGQKIMTIFDLIDFEPGRHLTIALNNRVARIFGNTIISYLIVRQNHQSCRLLVKLLVNYPKGVLGERLGYILAFGDLVMMRRQLINFKHLCERV